MTPADRRQRLINEIRAKGRARAREDPPLTERQIERLAFILAPHVAAPSRPAADLKQAA